LRVISGNEEALLISKGVLAHETRARGRFALVDIGGGSVEISLCVGKRVLYSASYDLGVARLQQVFLKTIPPKPAVKGTLDPVQQLRRYIRGVLTYNLPPGKWPRVQKIIGSSGTANALARIFKKIYGHNGSFSKSYVTKLVEQMRDSSIQSLLKTPGMESKRVDLILAGAILLEEIMQVLCADKVFSTDCSLRDGILEEELKNFHSRKKSPGTFHLQDAYQYAQHLGADMHHADQVAKLSLRLFDSLKRLHKLKPKWKKYLSEAAYLHDTGKGITPVNHALHSFYIVSNAHFASMDDWEKEFVAHLCLMHTAGKVTAKNLPFWREKNKRQAFLKLLSILRIADALDRQHRSLVRIDKVTFQPQFVTLKIIGKDPINLELLGVEQKKELFEKLFSRVLIVEEHF
jgi:exopolyphosphatase/guanosine-5'-triphosphate,3'-diphosphate pyrophosphatase